MLTAEQMLSTQKTNVDVLFGLTNKAFEGVEKLYELRFQSLFDDGRAYAFPCDAAGHVDMDGLSDMARQNYLYVRAVVGREFSMPAVQLCASH